MSNYDNWLMSGNPAEQEYPCEVCGFDVDDCICDQCEECGTIGDPACIIKHGVIHPLHRIFNDYESPYQMARSIYKYTSCGAWIAFSHGEQSEYAPAPDYFKYVERVTMGEDAPDSWDDFAPVYSIKVGSIIEGDGEIPPITVNVLPANTLKERFFEALDTIEEMVDEYYNNEDFEN